MHRMATLRRELGLVGAVGLGLGSILGTGVFVAIAIAAGVAGPWLPLAIAIAAFVAACNGLSSAQLAAVHPVAGGTYAYGRRFLTPAVGFFAGWTFLAAKSASAATAALGVAGYLVLMAGWPEPVRVPLAIGAVAALTVLVQAGLRRSNVVNLVLVGITLLALATFVLAGLPTALAGGAGEAAGAAVPDGATAPAAPFDLSALAFAAALSFVAFTGYGRVATLGEEVRDPRRIVPLAVIVTLITTLVVYLAVAWVGLAAVGGEAMGAATAGAAAPLTVVALAFEVPFVPAVVAFGAITAMAGVLLNLILGLSRVAFAMARDGEAPAALARLDATGSTPTAAVWAIGLAVAALAATGDVRATWSFSAVTVLLYYAVTNVAALRVREGRFVPKAVSWTGLASCLALSVFVPPLTWAAAAALIAAGFLLRWWARDRT
ncbi:MAG: amino acid permease [Trueperaceae bacterium]